MLSYVCGQFGVSEWPRLLSCVVVRVFCIQHFSVHISYMKTVSDAGRACSIFLCVCARAKETGQHMWCFFFLLISFHLFSAHKKHSAHKSVFFLILFYLYKNHPRNMIGRVACFFRFFFFCIYFQSRIYVFFDDGKFIYSFSAVLRVIILQISLSPLCTVCS